MKGDRFEHYELEIAPNINTFSRDTKRTATLFDAALEITEANQNSTEIWRYNIAQGYHTYYYKAAAGDIFEYAEENQAAS